MNTLHIINSASTKLWREMLRAVGSEDGVLLLADAVYAIEKPLLKQQIATVRCYAVDLDLQARHISVRDHIQAVSYSEFVALCAQYSKTVSWL